MLRRSSRADEGGRKRPAVGPLAAGLRLLGRRAHSRAELRQKLRHRGYGREEVEAAVTRLLELGYLDDRSFARGLVRRRGELRGPMALSAELAARGVDRAEADAALAGFDLGAQLVSATRLAERLSAGRRLAGYRELLDSVGTKLIRRGFSPTVVRAACHAVFTETSGMAEEAPPPAI